MSAKHLNGVWLTTALTVTSSASTSATGTSPTGRRTAGLYGSQPIRNTAASPARSPSPCRSSPGGRPTQRPASVGASYVLSISHGWVGAALPQHGPGRKHLRPIEFADWQLELTHRNPEALIRGLIHSDGCRTEDRFNTELPSGRVAEYSYVRYFFTNHSEDMRRIFIEHCELLGIRVTQSNRRNLSISHRKSVAILEQIIGPKS